jgi:ATP-dependent Zn protease
LHNAIIAFADSERRLWPTGAMRSLRSAAASCFAAYATVRSLAGRTTRAYVRTKRLSIWTLVPAGPAAVVFAALAWALIGASSASAAGSPHKESLVIFEDQLNGNQVRVVTLHARTHAFHVALKNNDKVIVTFPATQQTRLIDTVKTHGIELKVAKVQTPSHKRRDIVIGAAVVLVVLIVVAIWLLRRRRRMREEELGPGAPASPL